MSRDRYLDNYLYFEDGEVSLGGEIVPGILVNLQVNTGVRFDRAQRDHMSGKNKIPLGWEDSDIRLTLDLICEEGSSCYKKLTEINTIFKSADKGANPNIYEITNRHLRARGVSRVVFSGLDSAETDQDDVIQVVLTFLEHIPVVVKREKHINAQKKAIGSSSNAPQTKATPAASPAIVNDTTSPFAAGFNEGSK